MGDVIEELIAAKLLWTRQDGCPVAPRNNEEAGTMASIARRRWHSFHRRNENIPDTLENRVNDLARGLATKFELGGWRMVGRLIADYTWLAEQIAPILQGNAHPRE
jgi:hypothetical protein